MGSNRRSHSQDNNVYQNILQKLKKSNIRSKSLHKPTIFHKNCVQCMKKHFEAMIFYYTMRMQQKQTQQFQFQQDTQQNRQVVQYQQIPKKTISTTNKRRGFNLMCKFYKDYCKQLPAFQINQQFDRYLEFLLKNVNYKEKKLSFSQIKSLLKRITNLQNKRIFVDQAEYHRFNKLINKRSTSLDNKKLDQKKYQKPKLKLKSKEDGDSKPKIPYHDLNCHCFYNLNEQWKLENKYIFQKFFQLSHLWASVFRYQFLPKKIFNPKFYLSDLSQEQKKIEIEKQQILRKTQKQYKIKCGLIHEFQVESINLVNQYHHSLNKKYSNQLERIAKMIKYGKIDRRDLISCRLLRLFL